MCGIFGASLNPKVMDKGMTKAAIAKFKMLGIYNTERGRHSCGIYMGDIISKGVDVDKEFYNYIAAHDLPDPSISGNFTMIGHTRMATNGAHTAANAHPFIVEDDFVLAHNGVIRNVWTLCNKYGISHTNIHVDSLGLAHLIEQEGFKILNEYEGFAALLMAKRSEPNSLYVYRGVSKRLVNAVEEEERPLFYLQAEEGIYFSSLEKSLLAISDAPGDRVKQLEGNVVHKITNGYMTKSKFNVQRETVNYGVSANTYGGSAAQNYPKPQGTGTPQKTIGLTTSSSATDITPTNTTGTNSRVGGIHGNSIYPPSSQMSSQVFEKIVPVIWYETLPKRIDRYAGKKGLIYHMGRYWVVENDEIKIANGSYYINKKGFISPFKSTSAHNYYFYKGVIMKSFNAYNTALVDGDLKNMFWNFAMFVSKYTEYPVCNSMEDTNTGCKDVSDFLKYRWYQNGALCGNTGFTPRYSDRNYIIHDGLLHAIAVQKGTVPEPCIDVEGMRIARAAVLRPTPPNTHPFVSGRMNDELPFPEPKPTIHIDLPKEKTPPEWDVTHFYQPWTSVEEARKTFTPLEIRALGYYIADVMATEMNIYPDNVNDDQVDVQLNMMLQVCVENGVSVYDNWDKNYSKDILDYLLLADENPDGVYVEEVIMEDDAPVEMCEFVPKPPANVVEMVTQITESIKEETMKVVVNNLIKPSEDKLYYKEFPANFGDGIDGAGDPLPIDQIVAREQAGVPKNDDPEGPYYNDEYTKEDERDFDFQDIVDHMADSRECADGLQALEDDDFAQEAAAIVYKVVDPLLMDLRILAKKHGEVDLERYIKEVLSKKVTPNDTLQRQS